MPKIGVYICHCGENIAGAVDIESVREYAAKLPGVSVARDYLFMCSDPGQELIKEDIANGLVDRVVVAACTPRTHEPIFRKTNEDSGLNKYLFEMANIRDQDSWAHWHEKEGATEKAKRLIASAVAKAALLEPLQDRFVEVTKAVLVIGGGISGMFAALDIANMGYKVYLVERNPSVGGNMAKLDKTFPTNDCSACILTPIMVQAGTHPNIELMTYSEVEAVEGSFGNFTVKVRKKQTYVDWKRCTGCGACVDACPAKVPN
ncbi:MAG TPA: CoB--CoM heterodisulfide reductase iron-sulfur subunit A family protein, partial [Desulfotomaculum sp.]|nr:CoB--CoM heterodisulfide reductase iron-sulfur subunit A family protein [Desulfotomaculum sp.]